MYFAGSVNEEALVVSTQQQSWDGCSDDVEVLAYPALAPVLPA